METAAATGHVWVIVVAAGSGDRFGGAKQYAPLAGSRVLDHAVASARAVADGVILVVAPAHVADLEPTVEQVVAGGATRSASVRAGLAAVPADAAVVLVHDAARPLASPELFRSVIGAVRAGADAAIPVVPVVDTLWTREHEPVDRDRFLVVQTPQAFTASSLRRAHAGGGDATDDASLVAGAGGTVVFVEGDPRNNKITSPADLAVAEALLAFGPADGRGSAGLDP